MKHIKTFDNAKYSYDDKYYWLLPSDDRLEKSLKCIHCDERYIVHILKHKNDIIKTNYFFLYYDNVYNIEINRWGSCSYDGDLYPKKLDYFTFKGIINVDESELDAEKYNL